MPAGGFVTPSSYMVDGKQYIAIASGVPEACNGPVLHTLFACQRIPSTVPPYGQLGSFRESFFYLYSILAIVMSIDCFGGFRFGWERKLVCG